MRHEAGPTDVARYRSNSEHPFGYDGLIPVFRDCDPMLLFPAHCLPNKGYRRFVLIRPDRPHQFGKNEGIDQLSRFPR